MYAAGTKYKRNSFKKAPLKVIAIITLWSFLFTNTFIGNVWAVSALEGSFNAHSGVAGNLGSFSTPDIKTFILPQNLGKVKDRYIGDSKKTIIHIQDAHCNYAAQHKISELIQYLSNQYGLSYLNLEGGSGDYDLSIFTGIQNESIRDKVADHFVKQGLVNGAEYCAIRNPEKLILWGVEDTDLYQKNLSVYRNSLPNKELINKNLDAVSHIIGNLKRHIYNQGLKDIDEKYKSYKLQNLDFKDYLAYLLNIAKSKNLVIDDLKNIKLLNKAMEFENDIDFRQANSERDEIIKRLEGRLSKNELEDLVRKTVLFKTEEIAKADFYAYLVSLSKSINLDLTNFPNLQKYIAYISTYDDIDKFKLMKEVTGIEDRIRENMYTNEDQKELALLSKHLVLIKNLFSVTLTKTDYQYLTKNYRFFDMVNYVNFIDKKAPIYGISTESVKGVKRLDEWRDEIINFYKYSFERDDAFLKNLRYDDNQKTIIITGGFHTENLCQLFKENGISYISIMPNFKNGDNYENPYFSLLAGEECAFQKKLLPIVASTSSIQIASMLSNAIASDVWGRANIDAFRAAVLVQEQIIKGRAIVDISKDGNDVVFHMADGTTERMTVRSLLDAVHQREIDGQMEKLSEGDFEDIEKIDEILDEIISFLRSIGASKEIRDRVKVLKGTRLSTINGETKDRALVRLVNGVNFRGHAGGQGIRLNANMKGSPRKLRGVLVHEVIAGLFGDHFLAEQAEQIFLAGQTDRTKLKDVQALRTGIWDMSPEERLEVDRDFVETEIEDLEKRLIEARTKLKELLVLTEGDKRKLVVQGDIHGELSGFKENLKIARLINEDDKWIGGDAVLVQMGDVIDRGPDSRKAYEYLASLQEQARMESGDVVRLLGNHELMLIQDPENARYYVIDTLMQVEGLSVQEAVKEAIRLAEVVKNDIKNGKVVAAHYANGRIIVHGGLRSIIREGIIREIAKEKGLSVDQITPEQIVDRINEITREAVLKDDYSHPIFQASADRGGTAEVGGIFWEDYGSLTNSIGAGEAPQIGAHTPGDGIRATDSISRINVDAGLLDYYGGNQAFLVMEAGQIKVVEKVNGDFEERVLGEYNIGAVDNLMIEPTQNEIDGLKQQIDKIRKEKQILETIDEISIIPISYTKLKSGSNKFRIVGTTSAELILGVQGEGEDTISIVRDQLNDEFVVIYNGKEYVRFKTGETITIGRAADRTVVIDENASAVSRKHLSITAINGETLDFNDSSSFGTEIRGSRTDDKTITEQPTQENIIEHNENMLNSDKFLRTLMRESIGGNAGMNRGAVNVAVDVNGQIMAIGNIQTLDKDVQEKLSQGIYKGVSFRVFFNPNYLYPIELYGSRGLSNLSEVAFDSIAKAIIKYNSTRAKLIHREIGVPKIQKGNIIISVVTGTVREVLEVKENGEIIVMRKPLDQHGLVGAVEGERETGEVEGLIKGIEEGLAIIKQDKVVLDKDKLDKVWELRSSIKEEVEEIAGIMSFIKKSEELLEPTMSSKNVNEIIELANQELGKRRYSINPTVFAAGEDFEEAKNESYRQHIERIVNEVVKERFNIKKGDILKLILENNVDYNTKYEKISIEDGELLMVGQDGAEDYIGQLIDIQKVKGVGGFATIPENVLTRYLRELQESGDATARHRTLKLIAASINEDPAILQQRGAMPESQIRDTLSRLNEYSGEKDDEIIRAAGRETDYESIRAELSNLGTTGEKKQEQAEKRTKVEAPDRILLEDRLGDLENARRKIAQGVLPDIINFGDQHGEAVELRKILQQARQAADDGRQLVVVGHGDAFDRGLQNFENFRILRELKQLSDKNDNISVHLLFGNHDAMLIQGVLLGDENALAMWIGNGGQAFIQELGINVRNVQDIVNNSQIRELALWLVENLEVFHIDKRGFLHIHAGIPIDKAGNPLVQADQLNSWQQQLKNIQQGLKKEEVSINDILVKQQLSSIFEDAQNIMWIKKGDWIDRIIGSQIGIDESNKIKIFKILAILFQKQMPGQNQARISQAIEENWEQILIRNPGMFRQMGIDFNLLDANINVDMLDNFLAKLGVNGIVFGHIHETQLLNIDNRIFCVDVNEGDPGYLVFNGEGIRFNAAARAENIVASQAQMLAGIDEEIIRLKRILGEDTNQIEVEHSNHVEKAEVETPNVVKRSVARQEEASYPKELMKRFKQQLQVAWANGAMGFMVRESTQVDNALRIWNFKIGAEIGGVFIRGPSGKLVAGDSLLIREGESLSLGRDASTSAPYTFVAGNKAFDVIPVDKKKLVSGELSSVTSMDSNTVFVLVERDAPFNESYFASSRTISITDSNVVVTVEEAATSQTAIKPVIVLSDKQEAMEVLREMLRFMEVGLSPTAVQAPIPIAAESGKPAFERVQEEKVHRDISTLNQDILQAEEQLRSIGLGELPRIGFHGERKGHKPEGDFWYFVLDPNLNDYWRDEWKENDIDAMFKLRQGKLSLSDVFMESEEFFERLQGTIIFTASYARNNPTEGVLPEIYLLLNAPSKGFELTDKSAKGEESTVFTYDPERGNVDYRFFYVEGDKSADNVPEEAIAAKITLTQTEFDAATAWADTNGSGVLGAEFFINRVLYKKTLEEILNVMKSGQKLEVDQAEPGVSLDSIEESAPTFAETPQDFAQPVNVTTDDLRTYLRGIQEVARQNGDATKLHRTLKLIAASISQDAEILTQRGPLQKEQIKDTYSRLNEFSFENTQELIRIAKRGEDYGPIRGEIAELGVKEQSASPVTSVEDLWVTENGLHQFMEMISSNTAEFETHLDTLNDLDYGRQVSIGSVIRALTYFTQFNQGIIVNGKDLNGLFEAVGRLKGQIDSLIRRVDDGYIYSDKRVWIGIGGVLDKTNRLVEEYKSDFISRIQQQAVRVPFISSSWKGGNVSCGTICESGHEGAYNALDNQLSRQFSKFRGSLGITEERDLTQKEADLALVNLGYINEQDLKTLQEIRSEIRQNASVPETVNIYFGIPENNTELFWVDQDYGAGHFNQVGSRMHISLPFILNRGINAGIAVAEHELAHINGQGHTDIDIELIDLINSAKISDLGRKMILTSQTISQSMHMESKRRKDAILHSIPAFLEYLTSKFPQTDERGRLNYYLSGSLVPMMLATADNVTALNTEKFPEVTVGNEIQVPEDLRAILSEFARKIGDLDYVRLPHYDALPFGEKLGKGGGSLIISEMSEDARNCLDLSINNQNSVQTDPLETLSYDAIKVTINGQDYYISSLLDIFAYKFLHYLEQSYNLRKKDKFINDIEVLSNTLAKMYPREKVIEKVHDVILNNNPTLVDNSYIPDTLSWFIGDIRETIEDAIAFDPNSHYLEKLQHSRERTVGMLKILNRLKSDEAKKKVMKFISDHSEQIDLWSEDVHSSKNRELVADLLLADDRKLLKEGMDSGKIKYFDESINKPADVTRESLLALLTTHVYLISDYSIELPENLIDKQPMTSDLMKILITLDENNIDMELRVLDFVFSKESPSYSVIETLSIADRHLRSLVYTLIGKVQYANRFGGRVRISQFLKDISADKVYKDKILDFATSKWVTISVEEKIQYLRRIALKHGLGEGKLRFLNAPSQKDKLKEFVDTQTEIAKDVITDLRQGSTDIIVMPGSELYEGQQFSVGKGTERKLRRDYGQSTIPLHYTYGAKWQENLRPVLERALRDLQSKIAHGDKAARVLVDIPQGGRSFVEDILNLGEFKDLKNRFSVVEMQDIPENGVIDEVMHIVLGKGLLNYERYRQGDYGTATLDIEAQMRLTLLIQTLVSNPEAIDFEKDPNIINKLLEGIISLRIKPIDFTEIQEWKDAQDEVLRSL